MQRSPGEAVDQGQGNGERRRGSAPPGAAGRELGVLIADCRRAAGLTQRELARLAGVGLGTVRDLEQGRSPRPRSLARVAPVLGLDTAQARAGADTTRQPAGAEGHAEGRTGGGVRLTVLGPLEA